MFAETLNKLLKLKGITPLKLAKEIAVPKSIVYEWKTGKREPSVDNLIKLSGYFGVSLEYLAGINAVNEEDELIVMLREAKSISEEEHDMLVKQFKENLSAFLKEKRGGEK